MKKTKLVGILNLTPDSFSDGGLFVEQELAENQILKMIENDVHLIDFGAISTRPGSSHVSVEDEISRFESVLPSILKLVKQHAIKISIDSYNFETIKYLSRYLKIDWINDQSGFADPRIIEFAKTTKCKIILMHHLSIPADPDLIIDEELNALAETKNWLNKNATELIKLGIDKEQIIIDPGIGFGKTAKQCFELINAAEEFSALGFEVLYGHSRKSFLNLVTDKNFAERDIETAVISFALAKKNIDYLRVHNVEINSRALSLIERLEW